MKFCLLFLTCANDEEADKISLVLLKRKLVFCVKKCSIFSSFLWKSKIDTANEILLIMDSFEDNFELVNKEVAKLHSYSTFVLAATPVIRTTEGVKKWIAEEAKKRF